MSNNVIVKLRLCACSWRARDKSSLSSWRERARRFSYIRQGPARLDGCLGFELAVTSVVGLGSLLTIAQVPVSRRGESRVRARLAEKLVLRPLLQLVGFLCNLRAAAEAEELSLPSLR